MKKYICLKEQSIVDAKSKYTITTIQPEDIERIRLWRNDQLEILRQTDIISQQQQIDYFDMHIWPSMESPVPKNILVGFFYENCLIGYGGLVHISWQNLRAEISFLLDSKRVSNKDIYSSDFYNFLKLIKRLAFDYLSFNRLFVETYDIRPLHISILESSGFFREGCLRKHVRINELWVDSLIHGCFKDAE